MPTRQRARHRAADKTPEGPDGFEDARDQPLTVLVRERHDAERDPVERHHPQAEGQDQRQPIPMPEQLARGQASLAVMIAGERLGLSERVPPDEEC
jgi:hypothetical protein